VKLSDFESTICFRSGKERGKASGKVRQFMTSSKGDSSAIEKITPMVGAKKGRSSWERITAERKERNNIFEGPKKSTIIPPSREKKKTPDHCGPEEISNRGALPGARTGKERRYRGGGGMSRKDALLAPIQKS